MKRKIVVVTGAGGFIGGHLVSRLLEDPTISVRAVDIKHFPSGARFSTLPETSRSIAAFARTATGSPRAPGPFY